MGCILLHHLTIATLSVLVDMIDTAQLESITSAAMTLSERERAKLARDLVASLDGPADISVAEARDTEAFKELTEIVTLENSQVITIVAFAHHSRKPGYWHERITP